VSERFLAQLETGTGNISLLRFAQVAAALQTTCAALLEGADGGGERSIALLGVRGAGKSTVGAQLARHLEREFIEVDRRIEATAGLSLGEIFELHGEGYYRRLEREVLEPILAGAPVVLATGGSIVNHEENFALLSDRAVTVWLRARAEDHWERVIRQGDRRPMAENPHAFAELEALLAARAPLYADADLTVDTSERQIAEIVGDVIARVVQPE
jgi:XRE family aerobic/anaerobic benzoate catabolism transcriptional regulator